MSFYNTSFGKSLSDCWEFWALILLAFIFPSLFPGHGWWPAACCLAGGEAADEVSHCFCCLSVWQELFIQAPFLYVNVDFIVQFTWYWHMKNKVAAGVCVFWFFLFTWFDLTWGFLSLLLSKFPDKWFEMHLSLSQLFSGQALERLLQLLISQEALASISSVHRKNWICFTWL